MSSKSYLIFNLHDVKYGIEATLIKEIFLLPELIAIPETPIDIVGILNWREKIIPVMHLDLRLGNPLQECKLSDSILVIECQELQIGLIINSVIEVAKIALNSIENKINHRQEKNINPVFIEGVTQLDKEIIILLNSETLIRQPDAVGDLIVNRENFEPNNNKLSEEISADIDRKKNLQISRDFYSVCCPNATLKERKIFRQRAEKIKQKNAGATEDLIQKIPLAVIGINGEYFGINLESVREFIDIRSFTCIPCCPKHIVGNINLRGEIVTLIDIRSALSLAGSPAKISEKAVIINCNDMTAGLTVDEVFDVIYLHPRDVRKLPTSANYLGNEYLQGIVPYSGKMMSVIDLPMLFNKGELVVNEEF
jgi:purine-binding chemotaxis protein CheW